MSSDTLFEVEDINGEIWDLTNGDRGVSLGTGITGIFDPPVKTVYEEPGNYPGARFLNARVLRRDITFGVQILHEKSNTWLSRDSEWRKAWAFDRDCKIRITTPESGMRYLKVRLGESPEVDTFTDPRGNTANLTKMVVIAGDPFWYEDDVVYTATTHTNTTFDPTSLPWPWPYDTLPKETLTITVDPSDGKGGLNPTDQAVFLKWTLPGSTQAPSAPYVPGVPWLGAPHSKATIWTVPDYSFEDDEFANRRLRLPGLIGGLRTCEVQKASIVGNTTTGGSIWFRFPGPSGPITSAVLWNATAAQVQTVLEALPAINPGDVLVTGGPTSLAPMQPWKIAFQGQYAGVDVAKMGFEYLISDGSGNPTSAILEVVTEGFTAPAENVVVDTDPRVEQITSESGSQIWSRMNGVRFRNPVPPYTKSKTFTIEVSGCISGQMISLRIPRPWSRPWGLE